MLLLNFKFKLHKQETHQFIGADWYLIMFQYVSRKGIIIGEYGTLRENINKIYLLRLLVLCVHEAEHNINSQSQ